MFEVQKTRPVDDTVGMWALQNSLLQELEANLGLRDKSKQIFQPQFHDGRPIMINTPDLSGCFAKLSASAAGFWPTAAYELAHESVHMLNPIVGMARVLEEGVAIAFSLDVWRRLEPKRQIELPIAYARALSLVRVLDADVMVAARRIREHFGSLDAADEKKLSALFPYVENGKLLGLAERFSDDFH